jgi:hypothetical protein
MEDENMLLELVLSGKHLLGLAKLLGQPPHGNTSSTIYVHAIAFTGLPVCQWHPFCKPLQPGYRTSSERPNAIASSLVLLVLVLLRRYGCRTVAGYSSVVKPFKNVTRQLPNRYMGYPVVA